MSRAVRAIADAARRADPECEVTTCAASELTPGQLPELLSSSLFAQRRVVVITQGQDAGKPLVEALIAQARDLPADTIVVVTHAGGAKGKALVDGLAKAGARQQRFTKMAKAKDRCGFVRDEVITLGGRCLPGAAELITDAVGGDLRELSTACAQLVNDTGGTVDEDAVRRYYRGRAEASGFTVADAVMAGDEAGALEALRWALAAGVDPVPIADALADGVRTVARVSAAGRGNAYQLASGLGMPPWKVEKAQRTARGWNAQSLTAAMRITADTNAGVKGVAHDRVFALEAAVIAMIAARAGVASVGSGTAVGYGRPVGDR